MMKRIAKGFKFSIFNLLLLLSFCSIFSQEIHPRIKYYTLEDGLSQATVNDLLQDQLGFVWVATQNGLNRFDGKEFKQFMPIENDFTTISGRFIEKLFQDHLGNIWIATIGKGLCYYDYEIEKFHRIKLENDQAHADVITDIAQDQSENMWIASGLSGLFKLKLLKNGEITKQKIFSPNHSLSALYADYENNLWVGNWEGKIYKFSDLDKHTPKKELEFQVTGAVRSFFRTKKQLLIGTDDGLFRYEFETKHTQLIELKTGNNNSKIKNIRELLPNNDKTIWIATSNGLFLFNYEVKKILKEIYNTTIEKEGLSSAKVLSLLRLPDNQLLVGTGNGLNSLDFKEPIFKNISKNKLGKHLLNDNIVFSLLKDAQDLWVGTLDGGLNLIRNNKSYYFKENENDPKSISSNIVRAIVKDSLNNRLWIATTKGLSMLDLETFSLKKPEFIVFNYEPNNPNSINEDFIKDIALDENNNLWGATFSKGIFKLEMLSTKEVKITRYVNQKNNPNSISNNFTNRIRIDTLNTIWIGSQGGLTKLKFNHLKEPVFLNFNRVAAQKNTLSHNTVYDILIDKKENIWVGTRDGLNLFLGENKFESWKEQNQFPNTIIYSLLEDDKGNLWLGTNDGLVFFNTQSKKFARYTTADGIQSNEFNIHSKFNDNNQLFISGIGGITYFDPKKVADIDKEKPLYFSQLKIKNELITSTNNSEGLLKKPLLNTTKLDLSYNQFPFYLNFSTVNFQFNKNVSYGYKLVGQDNEWNLINNKEIQFLSLSPGEYTLQVNGFSRGIKWKQKPLEIILNISPPWYKTWWAYTIYGLAFFSTIILLYRFNLNRKLTIVEKQKTIALDNLKSKMYANITHEFRTPLTVILGMAETLKTNVLAKSFEGAEKSLEMIRRNGKNLLQLVNEMLDLAKVESGSMELNLVQTDAIPFVKYLSESFHSLAEAKNINLTVYSEIDALEMDVDVNKMASIISNLLSNAIKFTEANGKIIVHLNKIKTENSEILSIKIQDNGLGLAEDDLAHLFDRFYQADNQSLQYQEGTGIGLSLALEFVKLMNGTISVESTLGKGSTFTVQIPVSNNAVKIADAKITAELPIKKTANSTKPEPLVLDEVSALPLALLIEDNEDVAHYLNTCLKGKYQTMHASNGTMGIEMAIENIPDIIISDVMMPGKDGFEVCATLKLDARTDHIPIILLTAKATTEDRLMGLSHGADAYLAKPFNEKELFIRLDQLLLLRKKLIEKIQKEGFSTFLDKQAESPETKFLKKAIQCINNNIENVEFGSGDLAIKLNLSESQTYRKLKAITNKSTGVFIRSIRLQKAKELLQTTNKTISEIAYETGFTNPSWFSRAFKSEFGFAPNDISK